MCRLLDGTVRLQYDHPPNRPFFISLFRQMVSVGRKGCPRTALELGRLLFSSTRSTIQCIHCSISTFTL